MDLDDLEEEVDKLFHKKAQKIKTASKWVRIVLVLGGTMLAGVFTVFGGSDVVNLAEPATWTARQVGGAVGLGLAFTGGIFVVFADDNSVEELLRAQQATSRAKDQRYEILRTYDELLGLNGTITRLKSLYGAFWASRGALERALSSFTGNEAELVERIMEKVAARSFRIALNFELSDVWTMCVYETRWNAEKRSNYLHLVAHHRSFDCEKEHARTWREGIGVGGIALAKRDEVAIPDVDDPAVGTTFQLDDEVLKPEDRIRYKSMFAVPIFVDEEDEPWGVVIATSDQTGHFGARSISGLSPEEAVRGMAGLAALAVSVGRVNTKLKDGDDCHE